METKLQELLDNEINLAQGHISQGSTSHNFVRGLLVNKSKKDTNFPWLLDGDFLSGSYARGTKLHPLDDIDIMIVMDGQGLFPTDKGVPLATHSIRGNTDNHHSPIHQYIGADSQLDSRVILELFRTALLETYPNSKITKQGQAINIYLSSYGLGLDIVPCFHLEPHDPTSGRDMYYIPMGNNNPGWLKTNPKIDAEISTFLHEKHNKKLKSVIKLLKYWNREKNFDRIRSYHLETIAWWTFHNHASAITSLTEGVRYFFANARQYLANTCKDTTGLSEQVDTYMSLENRNLSLATFDRAHEAIRLRGLPIPINNWGVVFGNKVIS